MSKLGNVLAILWMLSSNKNLTAKQISHTLESKFKLNKAHKAKYFYQLMNSINLHY